MIDLIEIFLFTASVLIILLYYVSNHLQNVKQKRPPGPRGLPVLGFLPFLGDLPHKTFKDLSQKYGNIIGLRLGLSNAVVLNDYESLKEAFTNPAVLDRPTELFDLHAGGLGFTATNGKEWIEERRIVMRALKDLTVTNQKWEEQVDAEIEDFINTVSRFDGKPVNILNYLSSAISNNMMSVVLGKRIPIDDDRSKIIYDAVSSMSTVLAQSGVGNFFPGLLKVLIKCGFSQLSNELPNLKRFNHFMKKEIKETMKLDEEDVFINAYLKQNKALKEKNAPCIFSEKDLVGSAQTLVHGGSETTRTSISWLYLAMASHQNLQENIYQEIQSAFPGDVKCQWSDRKKLPLTFATIMELQRWKTVASLGLFHKSSQDTMIRGYHIPKGTFFIPNIWAIHNDPKYWSEPEKLKPERFLSEDGSLLEKKPDSYVPFSLGRRICPGETIAYFGIFKYFVSTIKGFHIIPLEGEPPDLVGIQGVTYYPKPQKLRFIPRKG